MAPRPASPRLGSAGIAHLAGVHDPTRVEAIPPTDVSAPGSTGNISPVVRSFLVRGACGLRRARPPPAGPPARSRRNIRFNRPGVERHAARAHGMTSPLHRRADAEGRDRHARGRHRRRPSPAPRPRSGKATASGGDAACREVSRPWWCRIDSLVENRSPRSQLGGDLGDPIPRARPSCRAMLRRRKLLARDELQQHRHAPLGLQRCRGGWRG